MEEQLLTVQQAAKLKGVSRSAIYKAIERGGLAHQIVLGHVALREADVSVWTPVGRRKGTPMSAAAKLKISQTQKERWAQRKSR